MKSLKDENAVLSLQYLKRVTRLAEPENFEANEGVSHAIQLDLFPLRVDTDRVVRRTHSALRCE